MRLPRHLGIVVLGICALNVTGVLRKPISLGELTRLVVGARPARQSRFLGVF